MPNKDMAVMVKTLIEQYKYMIGMIKTRSDKCDIPGSSNLAKWPDEILQ